MYVCMFFSSFGSVIICDALSITDIMLRRGPISLQVLVSFLIVIIVYFFFVFIYASYKIFFTFSCFSAIAVTTNSVMAI
jgi:hypothetical protein